MDNEKKVVFAQGLIFKKPNPGAPTWIKGSLSIKADEAIAFIQANVGETGWLNCDLKQSKDGQKLYLQLNDWKPENKA